MKIKFLILLSLLLLTDLYSQYKPFSYYLTNDDKSLSKNNNIKDETPAGNSISDIVTIGDTVWLGTGKGLSVSYNKGASWKNFYKDSNFGTESVSAIAYYKGVIAAATAHSVNKNGEDLPEGSGLRISTDNGNNWIKIDQPLDDQNDTVVVYGINRLRALPVTVAVQNLIYDIAFTPNTIWVASFAGGLRKVNLDSLLSNPKTKWERVVLPPDRLDSIKQTDTLNFCIQPVGGKFCSDNNLNYRLFSVIAANDSTIYAGSAGGINKSTDGGKSWVKYTHSNQNYPISGNFIVALGFNKNTNSVWGATWRAEGQNEFYGVSYSSDGGNTWQTTLEDEKVHNFGFDAGNRKQNTIIAVSDNGAFRNDPISSGQAGNIWNKAINIIDSNTKIKLSSDVFYSAAIYNENIYLGSTDGLARLIQTQSYTNWNGEGWKVYASSQKIKNTNDTYCYPNPFSPKNERLKIKYTTGGKQVSVTIRVYNFAMEPIKTIIQNAPRGSAINAVDQFSQSNEGVIDYWDGTDDKNSVVPNGVYFYSVEVDSNDPIFGKIIVLQ